MPRSRQLAAIMFTDIKGYTALMQQNEEKAIQARDKHRRIFNAHTEKYKGKVLQYYGDGTLSIFDSAIDAVNCGIEMQLGFLEAPSLPVRIGIHTGDIIFSEEEIIGDSVNIASRIESLAVPGSVFISDKVYDEIKNQKAIQTTRLKSFQLKNVEKPIEVYAISNPGLVVPGPEMIKGKTARAPSSASGKQETVKTEASRKELPPFLATKLYPPPARPNAVLRPRLTKRMDKRLHTKLTLVSAPAGFGKSTLVSEWLSTGDGIFSWLSLDEADNDPNRFLTYLIAALQKIAAHFGAGILEILHSPQPPPIDTILTTLLNEIVAIPNPFILVLDDYHLIENQAIDHVLSFLLDYSPPQMHLVIATREDPNLPIARLRVRGQLSELRAADLRFIPEEASAFLKQVMGLHLSADDINSLEVRTEGWIAGLQLAALSMQGREDVSGFIKAFAGDNRYIVDYLVEEVLKQQPEQIRNFLLQTSILERLSGPLCNAVTGQENSKALLETLERGNLFVVPLDDKRHWFRYHHLFADVLYAHTLEEQPDLVPFLHSRASEWYELNGATADAIRHALAAKDFEGVARLAELAWPEMDRSFQSATWLDWVKTLPDQLVSNRPVLCLGLAWAYLNFGKLEEGEVWLQKTERSLDAISIQKQGTDASPDQIIVIDEIQFQKLPASIATARAYKSQSLGDIPTTVQYARQALELLPENDHLERGPAAALLGLSYWAIGDLEPAYRALAEAMADFQSAGNLSFAISGTYGLADIRIAQGRLHEAISTYKRALQLALAQGDPILTGTTDLYFGLSNLFHEQGKVEAAEKYLQKSEELGESKALPDWPCRLHQAKARRMEAQGDLDSALRFLEQADQLYYRSPMPDARPIAAQKARVWTLQGNFNNALHWANQKGLSLHDTPAYLREFEHLTFIRALIAQYKNDRPNNSLSAAMEMLGRLLKVAEEEERKGNVIEILIMQALAFEAQGKIDLALASLKRALNLAEPQAYVRIFVDEGTPMASLLSEAISKGIKRHYASQLLGFMDQEDKISTIRPNLPSGPSSLPLVDPLSQRELEVLELIAQGLSNQEISERLFLALSTVKGHNQKIFDKLEVHRRTEAVARARQLGLL